MLAATVLAEGEVSFIEQELTYVLLLAVAALLAILTRYVGVLRRVPYTVALVVVLAGVRVTIRAEHRLDKRR